VRRAPRVALSGGRCFSAAVEAPVWLVSCIHYSVFKVRAAGIATWREGGGPAVLSWRVVSAFNSTRNNPPPEDGSQKTDDGHEQWAVPRAREAQPLDES
jgi:hypothetical protein